MELIDFTNCVKCRKTYDGINGNKISILFNGELY